MRTFLAAAAAFLLVAADADAHGRAGGSAAAGLVLGRGRGVVVDHASGLLPLGPSMSKVSVQPASVIHDLVRQQTSADPATLVGPAMME